MHFSSGLPRTRQFDFVDLLNARMLVSSTKPIVVVALHSAVGGECSKEEKEDW
jgi:hypothetical protein